MARTSVRQILRSKILTHLDLSTGQALVLLALADHSNRDGISFPSQETLADETGMQRSGVRKALTALMDLGVIQQLDKGGPRKSATYLVSFSGQLRATG